MKWVLCEVESKFCKDRNESQYRCNKPLQAFDTKEEADNVLEIFGPYYNYGLIVRREDKLDEWSR